MKWLEKNINVFFNINGFLMLLIVVFGIWAILQLGIPHNGPSTWTPYQWNMINFLWKPTLVYSAINILLAILFFMKKYFVFLIIILRTIFSFQKSFLGIAAILNNGFIYPIDNLLSLFWLIEFILAVIGTILWIRKLMHVNHTQ